MKKIILSTVACASVMLAASNYQYEITPMIGGVLPEGNLGLEKNYSNAGLALGINVDDQVFDQVEVGFLQTLSEPKYTKSNGGYTDITRFFANVVKDYPLTSDLSLYGLAGIGYEVFDLEAYGNENSLFGNYGAGIKAKLTDTVSLKFDLRHAIETNHGDNNLLYTLGLAIPFGEKAKPAPVMEKPVKMVKPEPVKMMPKDSDNDGIIDSKDNCPNSAAGAVVNAMGCDVRDDDKDGVINRIDECSNTIMGAKVDASGCLTLVNLDINFKSNSMAINKNYQSKIADFANMMKGNPKLKATINAYTDSRGSAAYNQKLSEKRAKATVKAISALNVDASRLTAIGHGEKNPIMSNETKNGRAANRRVTATISK